MCDEFVDGSILALQRSLEGILHPCNKKQFVERVAKIADLGSGYDVRALFREVYGIRSGFTHAESLNVAFPNRSYEDALVRARQVQVLLCFVAFRLYRVILSRVDLLSCFGAEGLGAYWGRIVEGRKERPFAVKVSDGEWLYDETRYMDPESFERSSGVVLRPASPGYTRKSNRGSSWG